VTLALAGLLISLLMLNIFRLFGITPPLHVVNSPIVVRGGSMAAFTTAGQGWVSQGQGYCSNVDTSKIEFESAADSKTQTWTHLDPTWDIEILGHHAAGHGLKIQAQSTNCAGLSNKTSVLVTTIMGGGFYQLPLPNAGNRTGNIRYLDNSAGCMTDEEFCERMGKVTINASPSAMYVCGDGDCVIGIGQ
jgi:hypothetical protein